MLIALTDHLEEVVNDIEAMLPDGIVGYERRWG